MESARALTGPLRGRGGARTVPGRGAGGRAPGDRAPGAVHLRGVGERRTAALADRAGGPPGAHRGPGVPGGRGGVVRAADDRGRTPSDHRPRGPGPRSRGRSGAHGAGGERVRLLRVGPGVSAAARGPVAAAGGDGAAVHLRRPGGPYAHRRFGARDPRHGQLRVRSPGRLRCPAPPPALGAADVHGVLVRLVRPLGDGESGPGGGGRRRRAARDPGVRCVGQPLHGARRDEHRRLGGREPRRGGPPRCAAAGGDLVRLRRPGGRTGPSHREVLAVPGGAGGLRGPAAAGGAAPAARPRSAGADRPAAVGTAGRCDDGTGR